MTERVKQLAETFRGRGVRWRNQRRPETFLERRKERSGEGEGDGVWGASPRGTAAGRDGLKPGHAAPFTGQAPCCYVRADL